MAIIFKSTLLFSSSFGVSGTYLSANTAKFSSDYLAASKFYKNLWIKNPFDQGYAVDSLIFSVASGNIEDAIKVAKKSSEVGLDSPLFGLVLIIEEFKRKNLEAVANLLIKYKDDLPSVAFWIFSGWAKSETERLISIPDFEKIDQTAKNIGLNHYNQAMYYASLESWDMASSSLQQGGQLLAALNRDILFTQADILYRAGDKGSAISLLQSALDASDVREVLIVEKIEDYSSDQAVLPNERDYLNSAIAQTLVMIYSGEDKGVSLGSIFYRQLANYINSDNNFIKLSLAPILFELGQFSIAKDILASINRDEVHYNEAQLQLSSGIFSMGDVSQAISILRGMEGENRGKYFTQLKLGDLFRGQGEYAAALNQYSSALNSIGEVKPESVWITYFFRGICYQELNRWGEARSDYLKALSLSPGQPEVLNYLGYSLIERRERLEQALEMIEMAIERNPQSGYIVDSLAWGLFKLGRYEEALLPMKRAYELLPFDPIINDHLGDILWNNGKEKPAKLYWKRALSFNPKKEEINKIKKKIQYGFE